MFKVFLYPLNFLSECASKFSIIIYDSIPAIRRRIDVIFHLTQYVPFCFPVVIAKLAILRLVEGVDFQF